MVKREATPPLEEDCKYFIINYPYPLYANVQVEEERHDLACWIASCIGPQYLAALYYKPSSPNMVIISVYKSCIKINSLLGGHKWAEFLKEISPDLKHKVSKIYYCRYSNDREVQKYGWRRLDVQDHWFKKLDLVNGPFVTNPYPKTSFCDTPTETQVDYKLCRPIPNNVFPTPKTKPQIRSVVPGSEKYVNLKKQDTQGINNSNTNNPLKAKSWADLVSSGEDQVDQGIDLPNKPISLNSSKSPSSVNQASPVLATPPGLPPPPGLPRPDILSTKNAFTYAPYSAWDDASSMDNVRAPPKDVPFSNTTVKPSVIDVSTMTASFAVAAINSSGDNLWASNANNDDNVEKLWEKPLVHPTDWNKDLCPTHKIACRDKICKDMEIYKQNQKNKARNNSQSGFTRENNKTRESSGRNKPDEGRGRGRGRGGSRARGNGRRANNGGWC